MAMKDSQRIKNIEELKHFKPGMRTMIVSHRGKFGGGIVENTLEAFTLALKSGADMIEDKYIPYMGPLPKETRMPIVEVFINNETDDVIGEEFIEYLHNRGVFVWANALSLNNKRTLCAWHDDNASLLNEPENGWGWLIEKGVDVIQTDWPMELSHYLMEKGFR